MNTNMDTSNRKYIIFVTVGISILFIVGVFLLVWKDKNEVPIYLYQKSGNLTPEEQLKLLDEMSKLDGPRLSPDEQKELLDEMSKLDGPRLSGDEQMKLLEEMSKESSGDFKYSSEGQLQILRALEEQQKK